MTKLKISPSSAAFMLGPVVDTSKNGACIRYIWSVANTDAPRIDRVAPEYQGLGSLNEARQAAILRSRKAVHELEVPFEIEWGDILIRGRYDAHVDTKGERTLREWKASTSTYVLKDVIEPRQVDLNHLAQLCLYLALHKLSRGEITVSYYQLHLNKGFQVTAEHTFMVELLTGGVITVDGKEHSKTMKDLQRWMTGVRQALHDPCTVPAEPKQHSIPYKSPCYSCPLKSVCASHKIQAIEAKEFLQAAEQLLSEPVTPKAFKFSHVKKETDT